MYKILELTINRLYLHFEKTFFLLLSLFLIVMSVVLVMQYNEFKTETKKMILVRQEYHHYLNILKQSIQNKNKGDEIVVDEDSFDEMNKTDEEQVTELEEISTTDDTPEQKEEIEQEQQEETKEFQFISTADEKQLKNLRQQTRQVVQARKKGQKKSLAAQQVGQLKKTTPQVITQDFTFHWPLELHHFWISSLFGARKQANGAPGFHSGVDLAAMKGTPVKAAASGTIIQAQYLPGYGNSILIQHNKYYRTRYAHLHTMNVVEGQKVSQGQKIGTVGATGSVRKSGRDASHLHFEIYHNGTHVNPLRYLFN